jgi:DNA-binding NtrC family response regulator
VTEAAQPRALIVDDDLSTRQAMADLVEREGFAVSTADTLAKARDMILAKQPGVVLCDLVLPDGQGTELLEELQSDARVEVILITGHASVDTAVEALRTGAYDYLTKPVDVARLKTLLAGLLRTQDLKAQVSTLRGELRDLGRFGLLVGTSKPMQQVYDLIDRVAPTDATVLLVGESGTGKELAAQTLHQLSKRKRELFAPLNCGAVAANLIESELFGHERGSFTGAQRQHKGVFERAHGGTLFLDEITEMPFELQVKLLRVLETGLVTRVGGDKPVPVNVRVLAATNRDPEKAVEAGKFREDLYYRLQVFPIRLPPLRQRAGDVKLLAEFFLAELNREEGTEKEITDEALDRLEGWHWPGNVRELKNAMRRAFILADDELDPGCFPIDAAPDTGESGPAVRVKVGTSIADMEKRLILATLNELGGDKKQAAETLGVSLKTLYNRLNSYGEEDAGDAVG